MADINIKAREICEAARTSNLPWTEAFAMHLLRHVEERIAAAEMRAGSDAPAGKPVAGEWDTEGEAPSVLCLVDTGVCVANVYAARGGEWEWHVYNADCDRVIKHGGGCQSAKEARAAAVEWAREHAADLDWRLPDAPASEPAAPRAWSDEEVEACAIAARQGNPDLREMVGMPVNKATMDEVRTVLAGGHSAEPEWDRAVLSHAATLRPPAAVPASPQAETDGQINAMVARAYEEGIAKGRKDAAQAETRGDLLERMAGALREAVATLGGGPKVEAWCELLAEYAAPPVQQGDEVTVQEAVIAALSGTGSFLFLGDGLREVDTSVLRRGLAALDNTSRRAFVAAAKNERK